MAEATCPTCGAPCTTDIEPRGGDYGWGTTEKERTTYSYASPPVAVQEEGDAKDAARYRWLKDRLLGADFDWNESGICALAFQMPDDFIASSDCDETIDDAMKGDQP